MQRVHATRKRARRRNLNCLLGKPAPGPGNVASAVEKIILRWQRRRMHPEMQGRASRISKSGEETVFEHHHNSRHRKNETFQDFLKCNISPSKIAKKSLGHDQKLKIE